MQTRYTPSPPTTRRLPLRGCFTGKLRVTGSTCACVRLPLTVILLHRGTHTHAPAHTRAITNTCVVRKRMKTLCTSAVCASHHTVFAVTNEGMAWKVSGGTWWCRTSFFSVSKVLVPIFLSVSVEVSCTSIQGQIEGLDALPTSPNGHSSARCRLGPGDAHLGEF